MKIFALHEGSYSVDASKKFIPFDPETDKAAERPASLFVHVQPFLIETKTELLVLDTGLGYHQKDGELVIHENIKKAGFKPDDVSKVLMSHLHFDHSGGMIWNRDGQTQLSFPHAEYIIQRGEWEQAYSKPSKSYNTDIFDVLQRSGQIVFVEGNGMLTEEISYELTGAHSEFHQVFYVREEEESAFFGGDVLPEPEQLLRKFVAKYDFDGKLAMEQRMEFGKKAVEGNWTCLFYHAKNNAVAKVKKNDNGFVIEGL